MSSTPKAPNNRQKFRDFQDKFGAKKDAKEINLGKAAGANMNDGDVIVTKHGAFKRPAVKAQMPEIFKLQRPIFTTGEPQVLVYNESRTWQAEIPWNNTFAELFGDKLKVYVIALPDAVQGVLKISHVISDQTW